jgi:hypothetical protein
MDDAYESFASALDASPGYVPAIQGLARLVVREGRDEPMIEEWLRRVALEGESEEWREWARGSLADDGAR